MRGVRSCFARRWRPHTMPDAAAVKAVRLSNVAMSSRLLGVRAASSSSSAVATATNTASEWKKRIEQGPGFADFLKASNGNAAVVPSEDGGGDDEMRRPTPEESLEQIRDMLRQIRETVSM